jgi:hypothetical protein
VTPTAAMTFPANSRSRSATLSRAGQVFLAVFLIVVFEGAVRKWVASSATLPLILLRDLLAVYMIIFAWRGGHLRRRKKESIAMLAWSCCVVGWGLIQLVGGESSPTVFIIGLRFWLLYIWFAVAAAAAMTEADYHAAVRLAAITMLVLAPLAVLQHYSPPGAAINRQLEGDEDAVFVAIAGVVRTTGTFSFTSGYSSYLMMVAPLVFGVFAAPKRSKAQRLFGLAVFAAFIIGSVVSGSRAAVVSSGFMLATYLGARLVFSRTRDKPAALGTAVVTAALAGLFIFFFSDAVMVTQQRFEQASSSEDFWDRLLSIFIGEPTVLQAVTWLGHGLGAGSNLAASLSKSGVNFALAESETGRILMEGGLLGYAFIAVKLAVLLAGMAYSLRLSAKRHAAFPVLLWLTTVITLMTSSAIGQLTSNGILGLLLTYFLLLFKYPSGDFFPMRSSR